MRDFEPSQLLARARKAALFSVAPWISVGNSFDFMHLRHVHGLAFDFDPGKIRWSDDHRVEYEIEFSSPELGRFEQRIRVTGPSAVSYVTVAETTTIGLLADDVRTLTGIRFKVGTLLKEDRAMARFLRWVHAFPTADPAAPFA